MARPGSGLVLVAALAVALVACGGDSDTKTLNIAPIQQRISEVATTEYSASTTVGSVQCPRAVEMKQGENFFCIVQIGGLPLRIDVRQTDDEGAVKFEQGQAVLLTAKMEEVVAAYGTEHGTPTSDVACGDTTVVIESPGRTVECTVTFADGGTGVAKFEVRDAVGTTPLVSLERS